MNKKDENKLKTEVIFDDKEDLEIKKVAKTKSSSQKALLYVLIVLFCGMLGSSIFLINSYYKNKEPLNLETIEINTKKNNVLITNNGDLDINVTNDSFEEKKDLIIEKISTIELTTNKEADSKGKITYDVKYEILENDFKRNDFSTLDSDVLIKFSYSYDKENWTYINNVISTTESTISPLMGNCYDISGVTSNLKIATNYELSSDIGEKVIMYWRSEIIFKNNTDKDINNNILSNFRIEYKYND